MDFPTQSHLTMLRHLLGYRLGDVHAAAHAAQAEAQRWLGEAGRLEAALRRLDDGVYGDCLACGRPIALQRLLVQPEVTTCAACESAHVHARAGAATLQPAP